jgi:imidazole glycerol phosphate synthase glutamine amidotransferase subunit
MRVTIVDSGIANLASVQGAFRALGVETVLTREPGAVRTADRIVLPGVGAFGAGMASLRSAGLDVAVRDAAACGAPLLAICLGLQLLTEGSEESPGVPGLGLIPGTCRRLPEQVRVPHLGWNGVRVDPGARYLRDGTAAYANSFGLTEAPAEWTAAWTRHGGPFVAALERENVLACQFHPELSGQWGLDLLGAWLNQPASGTPAPAACPPDRLTVRIIPCLDVAHGRVVKGVRFQQLRDAGDPAARAATYQAQGADEIVVLDVAASPEARGTQAETVRRVREAIHIPLTVGGGVRSVEDAARLLAAGADKVSVNTAAVADPGLIARLADAFGTQCVVLAIDARRQVQREKDPLAAPGVPPAWEVLINGGRQPEGRDALSWALEGQALGAGEILLTSWDRDGTRSGCDLDLIRAARATVHLPIIASGGIGRRQDFADALGAGADAALAASVFHDGDDQVVTVKHFLAARGFPVRP